MIEIKNVTKKYGDYVAVEDISFKVEESSIYGLVGYNGAGKTTLLKTAAGILKPESGEVLFDSQNVYDNGKVRSSLLYVPDEVYFVKGASLQKMGKIYKGYFPNFNSKVFKNMTWFWLCLQCLNICFLTRFLTELTRLKEIFARKFLLNIWLKQAVL